MILTIVLAAINAYLLRDAAKSRSPAVVSMGLFLWAFSTLWIAWGVATLAHL